MRSFTVIPLLTAAAAAAAATSSVRVCESYKIPVTITSENFIYDLPPFENDYDVADFIDTISSRSAPPSSSVFAGTENVTATYTIGATFCTPRKGHKNDKSDTVLIATHGLNFDRGYWDPEPNPELYSFVDFAVNQGYSVFFYDRLGTGESSRVSGYVAQLSNQVAILQKLTHFVKEGKYVNGLGGKPKSVVLVGHSFGSSISLATVAAEPKLADSLILTGFSLNTTYANVIGFILAAQPRIASGQNPKKWRRLDNGYLTPADIYASVNTFFKKPDYAISIAKYSDETKQPFAITEVLTAGEPVSSLAYTGPAMIISGEYDFIFCTSNCNGALNYPASLLFSKSKAFKTVSYPGAGHGLNLHLNAAGAYQEITTFLSASGL